MGCGYVTICTLSPEASANLRSDFLRLSPTHFFQSDLKKYSAVVVGPGLGTGDVAAKVLRHLLKNHGKVLVDADALTLLSQHGPISLPAEWILTPHAGELSRLLKSPAPELEADRLKSVERAVQKLNAHILFKGFRTVLGTQTKTYIIGSGNVALAKAGSGDVLAGFIGSLMAQGLPTAEAGVLGAYLQGRIADDWLRRGHSNRTLLASDLAELLDATFRGLKKSP
jgi:ADP-dependent NAD(P)H-hydrate dehydratase